VRYGSIGGLEYEVPQKLTHNFTAVHREFVGFGICRAIRRSSMTMKAHTYYIIFGRPPIGGGNFPPPPPLAGPLAPRILVRKAERRPIWVADDDGLSPADCPLFVCKGGVSATIFACWLSQNADVRSLAFCGPFVGATEHYEFRYRNK